MTLSFHITHKQGVGGAIRIYPGCERAREMADLLGCKVFTLEQLEAFKRLGFIVTAGQAPLELESAPVSRPVQEPRQITQQREPLVDIFPPAKERRMVLWGNGRR